MNNPKVLKELLSLSIPIILFQFIQALSGFFIILMVSNLGMAELSVMSVVYSTWM